MNARGISAVLAATAAVVGVLALSASALADDPGDPVIALAGDIACKSPTVGSNCHQQLTANLISSRLATLDSVFTLGDNQYPCGALSDFMNSYNRSWGAFLNKTHPGVGDQDIGDSGSCKGKPSNGYLAYFGARAQPNGRDLYYYVDIAGTGSSTAAWRVIVLNGNCSSVPCSAGSAQEEFLKSTLASTPSGSCIMAVWHQPYFRGSTLTPNKSYKAFWTDLYAAHAALVMNGHNHFYERYVPQNPTGASDPAGGITEIIAGTGGVNHGTAKVISPNTAFYDHTHFGVTFVTLHPTSFAWQFVSDTGQVIDSGSRACTPVA